MQSFQDYGLKPRAPLALTQGDPSGIGPELALKAWLRTHRDPTAAPFFVVAQPRHLASLARRFGWAVPIAEVDPAASASVFPEALPVYPMRRAVSGRLGVPNVADAEATIESIETCVRLVKSGHAAAVVTNPISKDILQRSGFAHPGHTEFLGELARRLFGEESRPVMMLWSSSLAVVPATIHVPLAEVSRLLTKTLLIDTSRIVVHDLEKRFHIFKPRLAVCGLNPHAGENGQIGREEIDVIAPAIEDLRALGIRVQGPYPADTMFHRAARANYDVALAMYHDQALVPVKTLAFDTAVNVTLGLPFVRTSPDHGTAFDIACEGKADPSSLVAALQLATRLALAERR
ncbi:MAG: 4-hydroxythreonine-4-phosphate dehydrogenase PdxA [Beijerinckiaceae bacterium]